jgi:hypothetical protein
MRCTSIRISFPDRIVQHPGEKWKSGEGRIVNTEKMLYKPPDFHYNRYSKIKQVEFSL